MKISKIAAQDAYDWAAAEMFYGEGAGTKRKLLAATIERKNMTIPGYYEAFLNAYDKQDFGKHAVNAAKARKRLDASSFVAKNVKAAVRGDIRNMSPVLLGVAVGGYYAHQSGLDKKALDYSKAQYQKSKAWTERQWRIYSHKVAKVTPDWDSYSGS